MELATLASTIGILLYAFAGILFGKAFYARDPQSTKYASVSLTLAILVHLFVLISDSNLHQNEQLSLTFVAALLAWLITITMFVANRFIRNLVFLPIVCFFSALFVLLHQLFPAHTGINMQMSFGLVSHILLSLLAFGVLGISTLYACQLSVINYQLKHKSKMMLHAGLPPLLSVESILYKLMTLGTVLLFIALLTGFIFVPNMFADGYAHKTILSSLALLIFIKALVLHKIKGLKARTAVVFNLIGIVLLGLGYFGSRVVREWILS
uniref:cytochrome C assembly family protein n=1 Tax=Ningiella ruwaisensis TaxID=2364274 RepID=UPI0010A06CDE|nr:cytochrome c biogenesis protein CcsA [Ningiella ruwaisensis]